MPTDWAAWSREAVRTMQQRNEAWVREFHLAGSAFDWDGLTGRCTFLRDTDSVIADAVFVGSVSVVDGPSCGPGPTKPLPSWTGCGWKR